VHTQQSERSLLLGGEVIVGHAKRGGDAQVAGAPGATSGV
jgi:hypothetical protein